MRSAKIPACAGMTAKGFFRRPLPFTQDVWRRPRTRFGFLGKARMRCAAENACVALGRHTLQQVRHGHMGNRPSEKWFFQTASAIG